MREDGLSKTTAGSIMRIGGNLGLSCIESQWYLLGTVVGKNKRSKKNNSKCLALATKTMELLLIEMGKTMGRANLVKESGVQF